MLGPLADRCLEAESAFRRARARGERGPELDRLDDLRALAARRLFDQLGGAALVKRGRFALWVAYDPGSGRASAAVQPLVDLDDDPGRAA